MGMTPWSGSAVGPSGSTARAPPVAALPWTGTAVMARRLADPGSRRRGRVRRRWGSPRPSRGALRDVGTSSLGRAVGRGGGRWARSDAGRLHVLVDPGEHVAQRAAQPVALVLEVPGDRLHVAGQLGPDRLEPRDLLAQVPLGVLGDRLGPLFGLAQHSSGPLLGVGHEDAGLGLGLGLGLVHELLGEQQRALQGVVADRVCPTAPAATCASCNMPSSWAMRSAACLIRSPAWRICSWSASASTATRSRYSSTSSMW